eukprot:gene3563-4439_t
MIPSSVKKLILKSYQPSEYSLPCEIGAIPSTLTKLEIQHDIFKNNLDIIPEDLDDLDVYNWRNDEADAYDCNGLVKCLFPPRLRKLYLSYGYENYFTVGSFPSSLTRLNIAMIIDHPLEPGVLPDSIKYLELTGVRHPLVVGSLPRSLKVLEFYNEFKDTIVKISSPGQIMKGALPSGLLSLKILTIPNFEVDQNCNIPNTIQFLSLTSFNSVTTEEFFENYCLFVSNFIKNSVNRLEVNLGFNNFMIQVKLLSIGPLDPFIYYTFQYRYLDGFIRKTTNLHKFLKNFL